MELLRLCYKDINRALKIIPIIEIFHKYLSKAKFRLTLKPNSIHIGI